MQHVASEQANARTANSTSAANLEPAACLETELIGGTQGSSSPAHPAIYDKHQAAAYLEKRLVAYVWEIDAGRYASAQGREAQLWRKRLMRIVRRGTENATLNEVAFLLPAFESWRQTVSDLPPYRPSTSAHGVS